MITPAVLSLRAAHGFMAWATLTLTLIVAMLARAGEAYLPPELLQPSMQCFSDGAPTLEAPVIDIERDWYSAHWRGAEERSLYLDAASGEPIRTQTVRFTWLPSFHKPIVVRIDQTPAGPRLTAKRMAGMGGYSSGGIEAELRRTLTPAEAGRLAKVLERVRAEPGVGCYDGGCDGSRWIVEESGPDGYRYSNRWTPEDGAVRAFGLLMLELTGWEFDRVY